MPMTISCPHKCLDGAETEATDISDTCSSQMQLVQGGSYMTGTDFM